MRNRKYSNDFLKVGGNVKCSFRLAHGAVHGKFLYVRSKGNTILDMFISIAGWEFNNSP